MGSAPRGRWMSIYPRSDFGRAVACGRESHRITGTGRDFARRDDHGALDGWRREREIKKGSRCIVGI